MMGYKAINQSQADFLCDSPDQPLAIRLIYDSSMRYLTLMTRVVP